MYVFFIAVHICVLTDFAPTFFSQGRYRVLGFRTSSKIMNADYFTKVDFKGKLCFTTYTGSWDELHPGS